MRNKIKLLAQKDLVRGSAFIFVGSFAANFLNYLFHIVTNKLGPEQYGVVASLISLSYVIGFVSQLINTVTTQKVAALTARNDLQGIKGVVVAVGKNVLVLSVLIVGVFIVFQGAIAKFLNIENQFLVFLLGLSFAITLFMIVANALLQGQLRFISQSIVTTFSSLLKVVAAFISVIAGFGAVGVLWGLVLSSSLSVGVAAYMARSIFAIPARPISIRFTTYTSRLWVALALLGQGMLVNVDVMMVKHFFPGYEAGQYAALATLGKIVLFFASSISVALLPVASKKHAQGKSTKSELFIALGLIVLLSAGILVVYALFPTFIIRTLYTDEYTALSSYLWLIGVYFMLYNISYTLMNFFIARNKKWILLAPLAIAALQISGIWLFHSSIGDVLMIMVAGATILVIIFFGYFLRYDNAA